MVTTEMSLALATFLSTVTGFNSDAVKDILSGMFPGMNISDDPVERCATLITLSKPRSQPEFSALAINVTGGEITGGELTAALREAFPNAKVGDRHGPHYLCKARTGKLTGTDIVPPFAKRSGKKTPMTPSQAKEEIERLQALIAATQEDDN